jgi:aminobenzoyl-glutamate transport protein
LKKILPHIAVTLFVAQLLLMLVSWLLSAAFPDSDIRSLLSSEGLRWFFGHFSHQLATPLLLCLLLLTMAYGVFRRSGILSYRATFRERRALTMTLLLAVVAVAVILLLTAVPHAVMLSAMGTLWPSPFSRALLPMLCFIVIALTAFYGIMAGYLNNLSDVYDALLYGIRQGAPLLLFYLLIAQLFLSVCYTLPVGI